MPKIDFTLEPIVPLRKRLKAYRVKWNKMKMNANLFATIKVPHHFLSPQLILSTFTHTLMFFFLFYMWRVLEPSDFYQRSLSLLIGVGFYYISQMIILKSFEPFMRKVKQK